MANDQTRNRGHQRPRRNNGHDDRTKFDKWLDKKLEAGGLVKFQMANEEELVGVPMIVDRYMIAISISTVDDLIWLNKSAILTVQ
jgi:hypothetical protein